MVKVMYNDQLLYKVVIWAFIGISLWKEKVALNFTNACCVTMNSMIYIACWKQTMISSSSFWSRAD